MLCKCVKPGAGVEILLLLLQLQMGASEQDGPQPPRGALLCRRCLPPSACIARGQPGMCSPAEIDDSCGCCRSLLDPDEQVWLCHSLEPMLESHDPREGRREKGEGGGVLLDYGIISRLIILYFIWQMIQDIPRLELLVELKHIRVCIKKR